MKLKNACYFVFIISFFLMQTASAVTETRYYSQKLDHESPQDPRRFAQKYMINSDFAAGPDAPVFFWINAEIDLGERYFINRLTNVLAQKFGMHFVALEHRFYGESIPFEKLSTDNLKYLTLSQTLQDISDFQNYMKKETGLRGPWIAAGGSYGGTITAYYKLKFPSETAGVIASCASVERFLENADYGLIAARAAGPDCVRKFRNLVINPVDQAYLSNPVLFQTYKELFNAKDLGDSDFLAYLGANSDYLVQMSGPDAFCKPLESSNPLAAFAEALNQFNVKMNSKPENWTISGVMSEDAALYKSGLGSRQWLYQGCSEIGTFNSEPADLNESLHSAYGFQAERWQYQCSPFKITTPPDIARTNATYFRNLLNPDLAKNILFMSNGGDPVSYGNISEGRGNNTNVNTKTYTIPNSSHCAEWRPIKADDSAAVVAGRNVIIDTVSQWLKVK